jgi:hypothetical protein
VFPVLFVPFVAEFELPPLGARHARISVCHQSEHRSADFLIYFLVRFSVQRHSVFAVKNHVFTCSAPELAFSLPKCCAHHRISALVPFSWIRSSAEAPLSVPAGRFPADFLIPRRCLSL